MNHFIFGSHLWAEFEKKSIVKKSLLSCDLPGRYQTLEKNPWQRQQERKLSAVAEKHLQFWIPSQGKGLRKSKPFKWNQNLLSTQQTSRIEMDINIKIHNQCWPKIHPETLQELPFERNNKQIYLINPIPHLHGKRAWINLKLVTIFVIIWEKLLRR